MEVANRDDPEATFTAANAEKAETFRGWKPFMPRREWNEGLGRSCIVLNEDANYSN
jgi:hypothetical protein